MYNFSAKVFRSPSPNALLLLTSYSIAQVLILLPPHFLLINILNNITGQLNCDSAGNPQSLPIFVVNLFELKS